MDSNQALRDALRLAVDPPGGVSLEALHELARPDEEADWDIATTAEHLGGQPAHPAVLRAGGPGHDPARHRRRRRFTAATVRRLVFLTRMRASGMPISDLRRYVALVDAG